MWRAPEPGESYDSSPKRRRTIGQRRWASGLDGAGAVSETGGRGSRVERRDEESGPETADDGIDRRPGNTNGIPDQEGSISDQLPWLPSDYLGGLPLDFDCGTAGLTFWTFNLGREVFQFVPLPTVDPLIVQPSESTRAIPSQQGTHSGHASGQETVHAYDAAVRKEAGMRRNRWDRVPGHDGGIPVLHGVEYGFVGLHVV